MEDFFVKMDFNDKIEEILEQVQKAPRYTGGEMNTQIKQWEETPFHFAFCFPDTYEVGMSHLGMKILTGLINEQPWSLCERCFMPWVDMMDLLKKEHVPLFSLESRKPLREFDAVGFTLMYEMSYSNVLAMLDMGGIPLESKDRSEEDPIVLAGGGCASNPEPISDFIDAFMIGAGEEVMLEVNRAILERKEKRLTRSECLRQLAQIEGVYVPSLYTAEYHADGTLKSFRPICPGVPAKVRKRFVADFDHAYFPTSVAVPYTEVVFDRITLEIMRGCTRGCRFCQAGMLYRPVRERSLETLVRQAEELVAATGYEEISLSSLSSGDYTCLPELIRELMKRMKNKRVSISLPSLRIDSVLKESLEETQQVKKSSLTFAPEAGTQRLRDVINKGVTEEDLIEKVRDAFQGGWSSVKLYFMDGLPTETFEDLDGIADLARKVVEEYFRVPKGERAKGLRVTVSCSTFVPKPHTPFQWAGQDTIPVINEKQEYLRNILKIKGVNFNWHAPHLSFLEACFSRGDRRLGRVLKRAYQRGCVLDGWNDQFKFDEWMEAFRECGLDPAFYANRTRSREELLPWDFLDCGITKEYLWKEKEKSDRAETTRDCRKGCNGCGIQRIQGLCAYADPKRAGAPSPSLLPFRAEGGGE